MFHWIFMFFVTCLLTLGSGPGSKSLGSGKRGGGGALYGWTTGDKAT